MQLFFSSISLMILGSCQFSPSLDETASVDEPVTNESSEESIEEITNDNTNDQDATLFDINSTEVQETLFSSSSIEENNLTFSQDVITEGMSQTEIEEQFGAYDLVYPGHGRPVTIYGNLGIVFSEIVPHGTNDEFADENVNPDENIVENVMYYAGLPYDEVVDALGEPDDDIYETEGGPVSGLLFMEYVIEDREDSTIIGSFWLHENESGEIMVDVMTVDEVPNDVDDGAAQEPEDIDSDEAERIELFITGYIDDLMNYYNNGNEDILMRTDETSPNYDKITANQASGDYSNHETYAINVNNITATEENVYEVIVTREYSHATSNGRNITEVEYTIVETPQGLMLYDYQTLSNELIE